MQATGGEPYAMAGWPDLAGTAIRCSISSAAGTGSMSAARAIDLGQRRELRRAEQRPRRRMSKRRRRQTLPGGTDREGGREEVGDPHYLSAKLLDGSKTAEA